MTAAHTLEVPGYQVVQFLGSGARSTIWQIRDLSSGENYALKRVVRRQSSDDKFIAQAENEYEVGSQLNHSNLRHIHSLRRVKRWFAVKELHLIMELCTGTTVQQARPTLMTDIVRIFMPVAEALAYMNSQGFVHADMKPNNILVAPNGTIKVIDLGQSCKLGTVKERIQGTPDFIAPEQVHRHPLDARTDVFNFGAAMYWTLTGKPIATMLPNKNNLQMKSDLLAKPPEQLNPAVPLPLSKLVLDCVEIHPKNRPESLSEVSKRLGLIGTTLKKNTNSQSPAE